MAFGANYSYNPYVNPYAAPYGGQQMQQQMYQPQMQQPPQGAQQPTNGFVWVNDINEAANYLVAPNSAVQLWDKNSPCVYLKTADAAGKPTMQIFDLVERKQQPTAQTQAAATADYVTRAEFAELQAKFDALTAKKSKTKSEVENDG